jgi:hypothetical protein
MQQSGSLVILVCTKRVVLPGDPKFSHVSPRFFGAREAYRSCQLSNVLLLDKKQLMRTNFLCNILLFAPSSRSSKNLLKLLLEWLRKG